MATAPARPELAEPEPEVAPDLTIPARPVPLTVWTIDGATLRGQIFLRLHDEAHAGPETVQDRLNDPDLFLTLSVPGDEPLVFLNNGEQLNGIVRIEGPAGKRRLSDFLNTQPAFLPLKGADGLHLLHKRFIAQVVPQET